MIVDADFRMTLWLSQYMPRRSVKNLTITAVTAALQAPVSVHSDYAQLIDRDT